MRIVHHPQNRGYGGALRTGFASATKSGSSIRTVTPSTIRVNSRIWPFLPMTT
ncbi:MAG: hypothetical protein R3C44_16690 [Chloroflexota bacterium]